MSYCVTAIAVDLDEVRAVLGSKDEVLAARLREALAGGLDQIDRMLAHHLEDDEDEDGNPPEPLTTADVLRHLVMGEPYRDDFGFAYGYCFEALCLHFGDFLDNRHWSAMRGEWFDTVQKALARAGVAERQFSVNGLFFRGPPIDLPEIDDFPGIGYLTKAEIPTARAALAAADLSAATDPAAAEAIEQILSWLDACARSNRDLVCTYA